MRKFFYSVSPIINVISSMIFSLCCGIASFNTFAGNSSPIFLFLKEHYLRIIIPFWVLNLASLIIIQSRQGYINKLEGRISEHEMVSQHYQYAISVFSCLCKDIAFEVFKTCNLSGQERVTIYLHNGDAFVNVGRYSSNPRYSEIGRLLYPDNEGCISRAWEEDEYEVCGLVHYPDNRERYAVQQSEYGINEQTIESFGMKSRYYAACAVYDSENKRKIAVVMVESVKSRKKNSLLGPLRHTLKSGVNDKLRTILSDSLIPNVQIASRRGF